MNRIATTAIIAFASLGAVAAHAGSVPAGTLLSNRELTEVRLSASAPMEVAVGEKVQVRAGDVMSTTELSRAGMSADDVVTVGVFRGLRPVEYAAALR